MSATSQLSTCSTFSTAFCSFTRFPAQHLDHVGPFCAYFSNLFAATSAAIILFLLFEAAATIDLSSDVVALAFQHAEPPSPFARCEDPRARLDGVSTGEGAGGGGVCGASRARVMDVLWPAASSAPMFASLRSSHAFENSVKPFNWMNRYPMEVHRRTSRTVGAISALLLPSAVLFLRYSSRSVGESERSSRCAMLDVESTEPAFMDSCRTRSQPSWTATLLATWSRGRARRDWWLRLVTTQ